MISNDHLSSKSPIIIYSGEMVSNLNSLKSSCASLLTKNSHLGLFNDLIFKTPAYTALIMCSISILNPIEVSLLNKLNLSFDKNSFPKLLIIIHGSCLCYIFLFLSLL